MDAKQDALVKKREAQQGSTWRKWDLHIHAPGTKLANGYGAPSDEIWEKFVRELEDSNVQAFGITDYFSFDAYLETAARFREFAPNSTKLLIPNIEFRLTENVSTDGKNVNTHVLIDPDKATPDILRRFLGDLETHITGNNGKLVRCTELTEANYASATITLHNLKKALQSSFNPEDYIVVTAAGNDGLRGTAKNSLRSKSISDELDRASSAFFGKAGSSAFFLTETRYDNGDASEPKPLFDGSDAHSFADLSRLSGDEPNFQSTWIKANLTFRGLKQTVFEPEHRVFVGDRPPVLVRLEREATKFIEMLEVSHTPNYTGQNGSWFRNVAIPFNPELTAIIGNKGSGKSAIADILALLGNTRQAKYFSFLTDSASNKKFRRPGYAENFAARLTWRNGATTDRNLNQDPDVLKPEGVKYLPQNYFESLTNEIEVQELRREIEDVVFSHVDLSDKMDAASFRELEDRKTQNSRHEASQLKMRLRELNLKILELEEQAAPPFRAKLMAELKTRRSEIEALKSSLPAEEAQPATETAEQQAKADQIAALTESRNAIVDRLRDTTTRVGALKTTKQELTELLEGVTSITNRLETDKAGLRGRFSALDFDIDEILKLSVDVSVVTAKIKDVNSQIDAIEIDANLVMDEKTDIAKVVSIPHLRVAEKYLADSITSLRDAMSAPQQRYQKYIQAVREISEKISAINGDKDAPIVGTVADLEARVARIDNTLAGELEHAHSERRTLCEGIFDCKRKIKTFYEDLKRKVENRLADVSTGDFKVSIDASFVVSPKFADDFLGHVNQNVMGPFKGVAEGAVELRKMTSGIDWNSLPSILSFADSTVAAMKQHDIRRQAKDVKKFYDFLYSLEYFEARYELRLGGKDLNQLSPGEKGLLLLVFYLHLDMDSSPLIIDQPEDNLDNDSIFAVLAKCIREAKKTRQVILVTHNPNLAVGADAEQIVYVRLDKVNGYKFSYESGAIENPNTNNHIVKVLEGSRPAFVQRRLKYQIT